jgi:hypothetical protein
MYSSADMLDNTLIFQDYPSDLLDNILIFVNQGNVKPNMSRWGDRTKVEVEKQ